MYSTMGREITVTVKSLAQEHNMMLNGPDHNPRHELQV